MAFALPAAATAIAAAAPAVAASAAKVSLMAIAKSVLMNVAISAAMSALQPQVGTAGRTFEWTLDPNAPIPFAAGRVGVAGTVCHLETYGPDKMYYGFVSVLSGAGPVRAITAFKGDDEDVTFDGNGKAVSSQWAGEMWFRSRLGTQPDTALTNPPGLKHNAQLPNWTAAHKLSGKASYMLVLGENSKRSAYPTGEPKPLVTVEGLYGWDPRLDDTYPGGAGPCRLNNPATWVWLENPILWALKWSLGLWEGPVGKGAPGVDYQVGGIGAKVEGIDVPAFVAAANVADANGWKVAAYPTTDDDKAQVLDSFLQAGGAVYAQRAGKISCIQRAAPRPSVVTITAADTAGPLEIDTAASRIDRINTIRPRFWSEAHRWQLTAIDDVSAEAYRTEDGAVRPRGIDYAYVPFATQAAQLAALQIANTREGIAGTIPLKPHLRNIAPGTAFTISEPGFLLDGLKCLCLNTEYDSASGVVSVTFVSETDAKYPFALGQSPTPPAPAVLTPFDPVVRPPSPGDWEIVVRPPSSGGGRVPGFDLVGSVDNATATAILVEWGPTDEGPWMQAYLGPPTVERVPITGIQPGDDYFIAVSNIRGQNTSARQIYGPYTAPPMVSDDTNAVDGVGAPELTARLVSAEALGAANAAAVGDLEEVFGDTVSAAASALAAAGDAAAAHLDRIAAETAREGSEDAAGASITHAGIATAAADEAELSASAAEADQVAARLTAAGLLPSDFREDSRYWAVSWSGSPAYRTTIPLPSSFFDVSGAGRVFRTGTGLFDLGPLGAIRAEAGRSYRYRLRIRAITDDPDAKVWLRWVGMDANYSDPYDFAYSFHSLTVADGWQTLESVATGDAVLAAGRVFLRPNPIVNIVGDGQVFEIIELRTDDVTESDAAEDAANAAVTAASQAEVHSGEAGDSAAASSGSAAVAGTRAGEALAYRNQAVSARDEAVEARIEAGTAASTAAGHAATASTEASEATDAAARAVASAAIAASVGHRALNPNAGYDDYRAPTGRPERWDHWTDTPSTLTRIDDTAGGYSVRMESAAGINTGLLQVLPIGSATPNTWCVVEGEVTPLDAGALESAGIHCQVYNADQTILRSLVTIAFAGNDASGNPTGGGVAGRRYPFSTLFRTAADADVSRFILYAMNAWAPLGDMSAAPRIDWHSCLIRPATPQEIAAGVALPALAASVETVSETVADHEANFAEARFDVAAISPGGRAILQVLSNSYGTDISLSADQVWFGENTVFDNTTDTLRTTIGASRRVLALGAAFGDDGTLTEWEGPSSVAFSAMSRTNAYFFKANVAPYLGGSAVPGGQTSGVKTFASTAPSLSGSTTISGVLAGAMIEFNASFDAPVLDADATMTGYIVFEEGSGGTWTEIGTYPADVASSGGGFPGGGWSGGAGSGVASGFGTRSGAVTYRATYVRTGGSGLFGNGYSMSGSVRITAPIT